MTGFAEGRPLCAKGFHFLDVEGATYTLKDGRARCVECKKSRARRSREKAKRKREEAERRARLREEAKQRKPKPPPPRRDGDSPVLNPAVPPGLLGGERAARYRLARMVRASRRT